MSKIKTAKKEVKTKSKTKTKTKSKAVWLDRSIAPQGPYLILCLSKKDYEAAFAKLRVRPVNDWIIDGKHGTAHLCKRRGGELAAVVCLRIKGRELSEILSMLVHEAAHVWQHYATEIGETDAGSEQEAYAIQMISQELFCSFFNQIKAGKYGHFPKK